MDKVPFGSLTLQSSQGSPGPRAMFVSEKGILTTNQVSAQISLITHTYLSPKVYVKIRYSLRNHHESSNGYKGSNRISTKHCHYTIHLRIRIQIQGDKLLQVLIESNDSNDLKPIYSMHQNTWKDYHTYTRTRRVNGRLSIS